MQAIDSDRDDMVIDTSRDTLIRDTITHLAYRVVEALGCDTAEDRASGLGSSRLVPTDDEIRTAIGNDPAVVLSSKIARMLLWPGWDQDCRADQPPGPRDWEARIAAKVHDLID
jgi:hypothetical protein